MRSALLFDLDGTLVDSDAEHLAAFQRVFAPHGIQLDRSEYAANIMGASNDMIARLYLSHLAPHEQAATLDAKEAAYRDALGELEPILGAIALLDFADRLGLKRASISSKILGSVKSRAANVAPAPISVLASSVVVMPTTASPAAAAARTPERESSKAIE